MTRDPTDPRIEPFWRDPLRFVRYPFQGEALILLIALSAARILTELPVLGGIIGLLLLAIAYKYAFTILRETANGRLEPPGGALDVPDTVILGFLAVMLLAIGVTSITAVLVSPQTALWPLIGFTMIIPAIAITLAMDDNLATALNPMTWIGLWSRIGLTYPLLGILLFGFHAADLWLAAALGGSLAAEIVSQAFFAWGLFALFHLMGYVLYQHHEALGFEPQRHVHARMRPESRDQRLLAEAEAEIADGRPLDALARLRAEDRERAIDHPAHELLRRLLREHGRADERLDHGRRWLHRLLTEGQARRALGLARECLDLDADFAASLPEHGPLLASQAEALGQFRLATDILAAHRRCHRREPERHRWALLEAGIRSQRLGQDAEARNLLQQSLTECEDGPLRGEIEAALASLPPTATPG